MPSAIFFDLDDTILNFSGPADAAWRETVAQYDGDYGATDAETVVATIDRHSRAWWSDPERHRLGRLDLQTTRARNVADALAQLGIADNGLARRIADTYAQLRTEALHLFPGARETLEHFRDAGVPMALLTNGDSLGQRNKIERFDLAGFFQCILIEGEFGVGKPDEKIFHHALEALDTEPASTWMVGDNLRWEIEPCRRLGLHTVWVDFLGEGLPSDATVTPHQPVIPHQIVNNIRELIEA